MTNNSPEQSELGKASRYVDQYDPTVLFPIQRQVKRDEIGIRNPLPFMGADLWTAYELSWLTPRGKPQVALANMTVPCETPYIVESKSFKLYLNSFNNTRFESFAVVRERLALDIGAAAWGEFDKKVGVTLIDIAQAAIENIAGNSQVRVPALHIAELEGTNLDRLDIECTHYTPAPELLTAAFDEKPVEEMLCSQLLKSNCLVTGQPDWGSVQIKYSGPQIDQAGLLRYIVSFRNHNEFHEQCVERMYTDIMARCKPAKLSVYARYTRRGGLDINPWRTSYPQGLPSNVRTARQ